jgi:hydrogenase small subunit
MIETFYDRHAASGHRSPQFSDVLQPLTALALGLGPAWVPRIAEAMETKPRIPVLWLHGLECTCCSASFITPPIRWLGMWCCR